MRNGGRLDARRGGTPIKSGSAPTTGSGHTSACAAGLDVVEQCDDGVTRWCMVVVHHRLGLRKWPRYIPGELGIEYIEFDENSDFDPTDTAAVKVDVLAKKGENQVRSARSTADAGTCVKSPADALLVLCAVATRPCGHPRT